MDRIDPDVLDELLEDAISDFDESSLSALMDQYEVDPNWSHSGESLAFRAYCAMVDDAIGRADAGEPHEPRTGCLLLLVRRGADPYRLDHGSSLMERIAMHSALAPLLDEVLRIEGDSSGDARG